MLGAEYTSSEVLECKSTDDFILQSIQMKEGYFQQQLHSTVYYFQVVLFDSKAGFF